jgi:hypothetical protein
METNQIASTHHKAFPPSQKKYTQTPESLFTKLSVFEASLRTKIGEFHSREAVRPSVSFANFGFPIGQLLL